MREMLHLFLEIHSAHLSIKASEKKQKTVSLNLSHSKLLNFETIYNSYYIL